MLFQDRIPSDEFEERLRDFNGASTEKFDELIALLRLDPLEDLQFGDFAECSFYETDLRHFNVTCYNLRGATFAGAHIQSAIFDLASVSLGALKQATDFDAWFKTDLARPPNTRRRINPTCLPDLAAFREAPFAPEMVVIPAGEFLMGSDDTDSEAYADEKMPDGKKRRIVIPERFTLGKYPVTFEEYLLFCAAKNLEPPADEGWGRERQPVINVSWNDVIAYANWLNERLGVEAYGLPSEAEFEYACRAGKNTRYWWGDAWDSNRANGNREFEGGRTSPVRHFGENRFKLADMTGNVWEWQADVWMEKLSDLPADGTPYGPPATTRGRQRQKETEDSPARALRGGSWRYNPRVLRAAIRFSNHPGSSNNNVGFRLSRTLKS